MDILGHVVKMEGVNIQTTESRWHGTGTKEAIDVQAFKPTLNLDRGCLNFFLTNSRISYALRPLQEFASSSDWLTRLATVNTLILI